MPADNRPTSPPLFEIKPPMTTGDKGLSSASICEDARRVLALMDDERHLVALRLLKTVQERLQAKEQEQQEQQQQTHFTRLRGALKRHRTPQQSQQIIDDEYQQAQDLLESNAQRLHVLEQRCRLFQRTQRNLSCEDTTSWIFASTHFGISTFYRTETDGSLSIRLEGQLVDAPLFEQVAVLREVDLHSIWAPFCSSSLNIAHLDTLDSVGWFLIGMPHFGLARDGCFRAIGCDNIEDDGTIVLAAHGIQDTKNNARSDSFLSNDPVLDQLDIPPVPKRRGSGRITIKECGAVIQITSATTATTRIVANVDPHLSFLPQSLLDFILKHLAAVTLAKLQAAAKRACQRPKTNPHAKRMRIEHLFYQQWLLPKFQALCEQKGWEMPLVRAFDYTDTDAEQRFESSIPLNRSRTYTDTVIHKTTSFSSDDDDEGNNDDDVQEAYSMDDGVIDDNMSTMSSPTRTPTDSENNNNDMNNGTFTNNNSDTNSNDEVSLLSTPSGLSSILLWRKNNPISAYLAEMEQQTQRRKAEKSAAARRVAAERLRPHSLSEQEEVRLQQLKEAKARHVRVNGVVQEQSNGIQSGTDAVRLRHHHDNNNTQTTRRTSYSQTVTARLHSHDRTTRLVVVFLLMAIHFALLHPPRHHMLLQNNKLHEDDPYLSWSTVLVQNLVTTGYIFLLSASHFITCDVALVYAFGSLRLGQLSGRRVRQFYSDNVRVAVAVASFGMAVVSIGKAVLKVWAQALLMSIIWAIQKVQQQQQQQKALWLQEQEEDDDVVCGGEPISFLVSGMFRYAQWFANTCLEYIVRSNVIGQKLEFALRQGYYLIGAFIRIWWELWNEFVQESTMLANSNEFHAKVMLASWREEAFTTAKSLFSYTAVFLITLLFLFNFSAKISRQPYDGASHHHTAEREKVANDAGSEGSGTSSTPSFKLQISNISSVSEYRAGDGGATIPRARISTEPIPETVGPVTTATSATSSLADGNATASISPLGEFSSSGSSQREGGGFLSRRRGFPRSRKNTDSLLSDKNIVAAAPESDPRRSLRASQSY